MTVSGFRSSYGRAYLATRREARIPCSVSGGNTLLRSARLFWNLENAMISLESSFITVQIRCLGRRIYIGLEDGKRDSAKGGRNV